MAVKAYDINKTVPYTLEADTEEPKTVFHLRALDSALLAVIFDTATRARVSGGRPEDPVEVVPNLRQKQRDLVRFGVVSADNLNDGEGNPVELKTVQSGTRVGPRAGLTNPSLDFLIPYLEELALAVENINTLIGDEKKSSA